MVSWDSQSVTWIHQHSPLVLIYKRELISDVQGSARPESPSLGSALRPGAQAYRNFRPSLGAQFGLGSGLAWPRLGPGQGLLGQNKTSHWLRHYKESI